MKLPRTRLHRRLSAIAVALIFIPIVACQQLPASTAPASPAQNFVVVTNAQPAAALAYTCRVDPQAVLTQFNPPLPDNSGGVLALADLDTIVVKWTCDNENKISAPQTLDLNILGYDGNNAQIVSLLRTAFREGDGNSNVFSTTITRNDINVLIGNANLSKLEVDVAGLSQGQLQFVYGADVTTLVQEPIATHTATPTQQIVVNTQPPQIVDTQTPTPDANLVSTPSPFSVDVQGCTATGTYTDEINKFPIFNLHGEKKSGPNDVPFSLTVEGGNSVSITAGNGAFDAKVWSPTATTPGQKFNVIYGDDSVVCEVPQPVNSGGEGGPPTDPDGTPGPGSGKCPDGSDPDPVLGCDGA